MKKINRQLVHEKYDGHCAYCGCDLEFNDMQVDHLVSRFHFSIGSNKTYTDNDLNDMNNLMPSCKVCNKWKSAHTLEHFRDEISYQLRTLNAYSSNFRMAKKYDLLKETPREIVFYFEQEKTNKMINKLDEKTAKEYGLDFDELLDDFYDDSNSNHRRGSTFFKQSIVEINEEYYPDVDKELYGFWETNEYVYSDDYGFDKQDIDTLHRVVLKEKVIVTKYWEKVKD